MPSFLALSERVMDLVSQLDTAVQPTTSSDEHITHVTDAIIEIEGHAMKIAGACSLPNSELPSLFMTGFESDKEASKSLIESHLKQIARYLNIIHSKALNPLLEKCRSLSDSQKYLQTALTESSAEIAQLKADLTRSKLNSISSTNTHVVEMEAKLDELQSTLRTTQSELNKAREVAESQIKEKSDLEVSFTKEVKILEQAIRQLQSQLEDQIKQRRVSEYTYFQEKEAAMSSLEKLNTNLHNQLSAKEEENAKLHQKVDELHAEIAKLETKMKEQDIAFWDVKKRHVESEAALAEQCETLQAQLSAIKVNGGDISSNTEIEHLQEQLKKSRKQMTSFEIYHKDSLFDQQKMQTDVWLLIIFF